MYAQAPRQRIGGALVSALVTAGLGWLLLAGLAGDAARRQAEEALAVFSVPPPAPPPPAIKPARRTSSRASGRAAPPNIRSSATQVAAPVPILAVPLPPPPIVVAIKPFAGDQATQGAAPRTGPGTGAGGQGDGMGAGGWGDGDGGGYDDAETPPRWRRGRLTISDVPSELEDSGFAGTVAVRYLVQVDGRVGDCAVTRSSGNRTLDDLTCRLIRQRFRYDPSRDARGRPVAAYIVENHEWVIEVDPPAPRRG